MPSPLSVLLAMSTFMRPLPSGLNPRGSSPFGTACQTSQIWLFILSVGYETSLGSPASIEVNGDSLSRRSISATTSSMRIGSPVVPPSS